MTIQFSCRDAVQLHENYLEIIGHSGRRDWQFWHQFGLHTFGLIAVSTNPEYIHSTLSLQYHANKLWNCYPEVSLCVMCQLTVIWSPAIVLQHLFSLVTSCVEMPHVKYTLEQ
jgi:hypothetical protein